MSTMTPIKIRGKRTAARAEKWHYGKQRQTHRSRTPSDRSSSVASGVSGVSDAQSQSSRRRKWREPTLSRLEQLPTEIIQAIFAFSMNPELPLASPHLANQLSSAHLRHELTSRIMRVTQDQARGRMSEMKDGMRIMNSKFFTWQFFQDWLCAEFEVRGMTAKWPGGVVTLSSSPEEAEIQTKFAWTKMQPLLGLLPPKKLLNAPFTEDKVRFLRCLTSRISTGPWREHAVYHEQAKEGLEQAVFASAKDVLPSFWQLGVQPDTELLRKAVYGDCDKAVVTRIVSQATRDGVRPLEVDFLDPAIWSWAEKARQSGDERGEWLMEKMREAARLPMDERG